jgi:basic membrane protein A
MKTGLTVTCAVVAAVALAACGSKSSPPSNTTPNQQPGGQSPTATTTSPGNSPAQSPTATGKTLKACMVLDTGGIDDHSFNQTSYAGMQAANRTNPNIKISYVPSNSSNDYTPNLKAEVARGCNPVIAVGGLMENNVKAIAKQNPNVNFAEVDAPSTGPNVYGMQFNTAQGAFLGGYLAAGMTKTGVVGTWGGINIPPVTIYMDGFWEGVQYYNHQHHKNVQVLGWSEKNQKGGVFTHSFTVQNKGKQISQTMISQNADIIFPVAGGAGLGAGAAAQASNGRAHVMWVDTDGCISAAQYCKYFLTSVTKNLAGAVLAYLHQAASGSFPKGSYIGTLKNKGTGLAPYHDFASQVPASLTNELNRVKQGIITGKIKITSPSQPKA